MRRGNETAADASARYQPRQTRRVKQNHSASRRQTPTASNTVGKRSRPLVSSLGIGAGDAPLGGPFARTHRPPPTNEGIPPRPRRWLCGDQPRGSPNGPRWSRPFCVSSSGISLGGPPLGGAPIRPPPARKFFGYQHRGRLAGRKRGGETETTTHAKAKRQPRQTRRINKTAAQANENADLAKHGGKRNLHQVKYTLKNIYFLIKYLII